MLLLLAVLAGARLEASEDGRVRLSYTLEIPQGVSELRFSALATSPLEDVSAKASGENLALSHEISGERITGAVALPPATASPFVLEFHYRIRGTRIPIVVLDVTPGAARSGAFTARVELPARSGASIDFPSNGVRDPSGALTWELPVLPAFVSWGPPPSSVSRGRAGFAFWGLFAVNGAIALLYAAWMRRASS